MVWNRWVVLIIFKIGEFSKLSQISIRMLRYYDEVEILKPAEIDRYTGYRLYSTDQLIQANKIMFLRDVGFGSKEIASIVENWDDELIKKQLDQKRLEIVTVIEKEKAKLAKIDLAKRDIAAEKMKIHYSVAMKSVPSYQVLSLRRVIPNYYGEGMLWKEMAAFVEGRGITIGEGTISIYHDIEYKEEDVDVELCVPVQHVGENENGFTYRITEAIPHMAYIMVYGGFENIAGSFIKFANWLQSHPQYRMAGTSRQIVHRGPWNEEQVENYLIEIQVPLEKSTL